MKHSISGVHIDVLKVTNVKELGYVILNKDVKAIVDVNLYNQLIYKEIAVLMKIIIKKDQVDAEVLKNAREQGFVRIHNTALVKANVRNKLLK